MKAEQTKPIGNSMLSVECWLFDVFLALLLFLTALSTGFGQSTIQFSASTYTVTESAGAVTLAVQRLNDPNTTVSVDYTSADGTATNGLKYTAVAGTLAFGAGETSSTIIIAERQKANAYH